MDPRFLMDGLKKMLKNWYEKERIKKIINRIKNAKENETWIITFKRGNEYVTETVNIDGIDDNYIKVSLLPNRNKSTINFENIKNAKLKRNTFKKFVSNLSPKKNTATIV